MRYRTIEIDLDIHKLIEAERQSFDEPDYVVLRRALGLGAPTPANPPRDGSAWEDGPVLLPHGTAVRMKHQRGRQVFEGAILDGKWVVQGQTFDSPSGAASALAVTKAGGKTSLNGWSKWDVRRPGDADWIPLIHLRRGDKPLTPLTLKELNL